MPTPPVLLAPDFLPLWRRISSVLDRRGVDHRGWIQMPGGLPDTVYARLDNIVRSPGSRGRHFSTTRQRLDLAQLERGLARHGSDVATLLADAGCPPTGRREARDADRERVHLRDDALLRAAREHLGDEAWVAEWAIAVRTGLADAEHAEAAVADVAQVLRIVAGPGVRSRGEVAARALGDAHRLDPGTADRRRVGTALALRAGDADRDDPDLWAAAGMPPDLVATPVLTWALPLLGDGVNAAVRAMTGAGAPTFLSVLALRELDVAVPPGTVVHSVENPRLLEAAVQQGLRQPMICTMGNPTTAPTVLIRALTAAGATVRHHGDLDPAGVAITARLADGFGVEPWRMTRRDYVTALSAAEAEGVELRRIDAPVPPTPWDPDLRSAMDAAGRAVDEERVMDDLLDELASS